VKTLHLTNAWHASSGGIGTFYKALLEAAEREGHEMRLVVPGDATRVEETGRYGRIYHIEAPRAPLNNSYRIIYPHRFLFPQTALQRILNRERPDLVEVSEKYSMPYLAGMLRTRRLPGVGIRPTVVGLSCERMDENVSAYLTPLEWGRNFCNLYMKWIYFPSFDHHITISEHVAKELIDAARGHKVRRGIWVQPMGVDCERFGRARADAELRREMLNGLEHDGATLLLYAGRLAPEKNLPLLAETMSLLDRKQYRLAIAGTGILEEYLRAEFARRGLDNVIFLGHLADRDRLANAYASADIFLHPNPREPFGIAPLEAMAAGLALVAPNSGGVNSYADESNAWLAEPSGEAFAAAVMSIRSDAEQSVRRRAAARKTAALYAWPAIAKRFLDLYGELNALTQNGRTPARVSPRSWSTQGDFFGREIGVRG
jgi:alpha-1,6-mannosyltransferase